jgi:RTX calcium-binding nonapeptide repeat (4 copies)
MRPARRRGIGALVPLGAYAAAAVAGASTSHDGWPRIDGDLKIHRYDESGVLRGKRDRHNELLGGHGNDTIIASRVGDVMWGDYKPSGQPTSQVDRIYGGPGRDFIYASHGWNTIVTGGGADVVHAHFGRGIISCSSSAVTVFLSHRSRPHYQLRGCRHISYRTLGH